MRHRDEPQRRPRGGIVDLLDRPGCGRMLPQARPELPRRLLASRPCRDATAALQGHARPPTTVGAAGAARVVLDTNAVLDWLWFDDPAMRPVGAAIVGGRCRWLQTEAMHAELLHVLANGLPPRRGADAVVVTDACRRWAQREAPPPRCALACSDPDDQMFIDLAIAARPAWLLTRDRALLALAGAAQRAGVALTLNPAVTPPAPAPQAASAARR